MIDGSDCVNVNLKLNFHRYKKEGGVNLEGSGTYIKLKCIFFGLFQPPSTGKRP